MSLIGRPMMKMMLPIVVCLLIALVHQSMAEKQMNNTSISNQENLKEELDNDTKADPKHPKELKRIAVLFGSKNNFKGQHQESKTSYVKSVENIHDNEMKAAISKQEKMKIENELLRLENNIILLTIKVEKLEIENNQLKLDRKNGVDRTSAMQSNQLPAFTAYAEEPAEYTDGEIVRFEGVYHNYGGHYHPENSSFVCPFDGYYLIQVSVRSQFSSYMQVLIHVADLPIVTAMASASTGVTAQASNLLVRRCLAGENIYVRCSEPGTNRIYEGSASTFTVTLLRMDLE